MGEILRWVPHPVQEEFLESSVFEILMGGARGGGKTSVMLADACAQASPEIVRQHIETKDPEMLPGDAMQAAFVACQQYAAIFFRRTLPELEQLIDESRFWIPLWFPGAKYNEQKKRWRFPAGGTLVFRYLKNANDWRHYQGHSYQWIGFEELTHFENPDQYLMMFACARSKNPWLTCYVRATTNPGGPGHHWVKARFIDAAPPRTLIEEVNEKTKNVRQRLFIPALVTDNLTLMANDPDYIERLESLSEHEKKAMRYGDWDAFDGMSFPDFMRGRHVITWAEFAKMAGAAHGMIPDHWPMGMSFDWGYNKPFSAAWWTTDTWGRTYRLKELYGCKRGPDGASKPDIGLKISDAVVCERLLALEKKWGWKGRIKIRVADPNMFSPRGVGHDLKGPPLAEVYQRNGIAFIKGDNRRVAGKAQFHARLRLQEFSENFESPAIYVLNTCTDWLRTVPSLPPDPKKPEDVLEEGAEDHTWDETRYWLMSRLWIAPKPKNEEERRKDRYNRAVRRSFTVA